jgi:hypothetical protein
MLGRRHQRGADAGPPMPCRHDDVGDAARKSVVINAWHEVRGNKPDDAGFPALSQLQARGLVVCEPRHVDGRRVRRGRVPHVAEQGGDRLRILGRGVSDGDVHEAQ